MPHPATMFFLITLGIVFLSWISDIYGLSVVHPKTNEVIRVQSLLSPESFAMDAAQRYSQLYRICPSGLGYHCPVWLGSGTTFSFLSACIRLGIRKKPSPAPHHPLGHLPGNPVECGGRCGYIILLPIAGLFFIPWELHPLAGIITAYVSVACGYSANFMLSTLDPLVAATTQDAALTVAAYGGHVGPLSNYYFMSVSTLFMRHYLLHHPTKITS
jgi:aminobenzoyl-glutamate transport protein